MATPGTLLYTLKGSQPIPVKLAAARSSLLATPTATTSTQIRDWALDALLKSTKSSASTLILNSEVWTTLEESLQAATGAAQTPTLPTFSSFVKAYSGAEERDEALLRVVVGVSRKLLPNGIRKASLDAALESWKELLEASLKVFAEESANEEEQKEWCELVGLWEKNVRSVGEAGKGGKKVPQSTLSTLPSLLPLLSTSLRPTLLISVSTSLFSLDNLKRILARDSYNTTTFTTEDELLLALAPFPSHYSHLPTFFTLYSTSLMTHESLLFPLPTKTSFPTLSAYKSASELHALQRRRALSANFLRGVLEMLEWTTTQSGPKEDAKTLAELLEFVEEKELFREGEGEAWKGVLEGIVAGTVARLSPTSDDSVLRVLTAVLRLSFKAVAPSLDTILSTLARTPSSSSSTTTTSFLTNLLSYHSRSLLVPSLLTLLSTALGTPTAIDNNVLSRCEWRNELEKAVGKIVGVEGAWRSLVDSAGLGGEKGEEKEEEEGEGRKKKRRKVVVELPEGGEQSLARRIRLLGLFLKAAPSLPAAVVEEARELVERGVKDLVKSKAKDVGREWLEVRCAVLERFVREGREDEVKKWELGKRWDGVKALLLTDEEDGALVVVAARTLLQAISVGVMTDKEEVIGSVLERVEAGSGGASWGGSLRGMKKEEVSTALWELVTRRWLGTFETYASDDQLKLVAETLVSSLENGEEAEGRITIGGISSRLLLRSDVYEYTRLQANVQSSLLNHATIPSLTSPSSVLSVLTSSSKPPKALRSLSSATFLSAISTIRRISAFIPIEYLGRQTKSELVDRALGVDLWVSGGKVEVEEEVREQWQVVTRKFVTRALPESGVVDNAPELATSLIRGTSGSGDVASVTLKLYRSLVSSAINLHRSGNNPTQLLAFISAFEKPLADLAKRAKKGVAVPTCEELAFCALSDCLLSQAGEFESLSSDLQEAAKSAAKSSSKSLAKLLAATVAAIEESAETVLATADVVNACRSVWQLAEWVGKEKDEHTEAYTTFLTTVLSTLTNLATTDSAFASRAGAFATSEALLDLLNFRIRRLRTLSDSEKVAVEPFETYIACHLAFRKAFASFGGASGSLAAFLKRATTTATTREYSVALADITGVVGDAVASSDYDAFEPSLAVALVLLRDGPEGSSRVASACLSQMLRHLSLFVHRAVETDSAAQSLLVASQFLEGICTERTMLFSRQNVSNALSLVSRILQPPASPSASTTTIASSATTELSSALFLSLVSILSHLIRHLKEHITPLFPPLVSTIGHLVSILRRPGYGTTGTLPLSEKEGVTLGKRAEREARATFPKWVWEGGVGGIGKKEAMAVGRLLAGLTAKSTTTLKRKRGEEKEKESTSTTSLAAPLSKHAPFIILPYVRACVDGSSPIPGALRAELQGGWWEVMDVMGKWEREALMKGFLSDEEEAERGVLREMWKGWEKERYRG